MAAILSRPWCVERWLHRTITNLTLHFSHASFAPGRWLSQCQWCNQDGYWCMYMMTTPNGEKFVLLVLCDGNPLVTGGFPSQRPVTRSFDVFFYLHLNKRLSKQSGRRWFETPSRSLDDTLMTKSKQKTRANKYNNWCKASKLIAPAWTTIWSQIFKMGSWKKKQQCKIAYCVISVLLLS